MTEEPKDPQAAGDKPASDVPGAGASAAPTAPTPPAKPAAPAARPAAKPAPGAEAATGAGAAKAAPGAEAAPGAGAAKAAPGAEAAPGAGAAKAAHDMKPAPPSGPTDPPPPAGTQLPSFLTALQGAIPRGIEHISYYVGDWTVIVPVEQLLEVARYLRDTPGAAFDFCSDVTATDWPPRAQRFDVIYCLYSTRLRHRVRMKVRAAESDPVPSVTAIWPSANWLEREVYDLFGVNFTGHPNRTRILMPDDWQGHPQRKDYPLEGPGELLMENPLDWLRLKQAREESEIE